MKHYSIIVKITLLSVSLAVILNSLLLSRYDKWPEDLFYYLSLFSVIFMMDFYFFELYSNKNVWKHHYNFYAFPVTRYKLLYLEIKEYLKRWELVTFFISVQFFIINFYYLNDPEVSLFLVLIPYLFQTTFLILLMFLIKNLIAESDFTDKLRTTILSFVFASILLTVFSEHNSLIAGVFYSFPLINGFLSFLISKIYFIISSIIAVVSLITIFVTMKKKFQTWPLC